MTFDVPRNTILPVDDCSLRLDPAPHPFETTHGDEIEENWLRETAAKPALFDGQVVLLSQLSHRARRLTGICHAVRFATFLYWRRIKPVASAQHIYAQAVPVSADGALMAVRMGSHTANSGKVYFASGSFEPYEFPGGTADVEGNMAREVREETGLDLRHALADRMLHMAWFDSGVVLFRRYAFDRSADELAKSVEAHVGRDPDPEIDGPVLIRSPGDLPDRLQDHMPTLIAWHFAGPMEAGG